MLEAVIEEQFSLVEGRRVKVRDKPRESAAHCQKSIPWKAHYRAVNNPVGFEIQTEAGTRGHVEVPWKGGDSDRVGSRSDVN